MLYSLDSRTKLIIMLSAMSALFLVALDQTIIATALGAIVKEFDSFSSLGFVVTAYILTTTITVPLAGKLSDMYGRKLLLIIGVVVFSLGSLLSGLASDINWLIGWRALQGIGGGIITASVFTIVGDLFTPKERGKWQGLIGAVFGMSSVAGPLLGGWLTDGQAIFGVNTDWRWAFFINVPIGIVASVLLFKYLPRNTDKHHYKLDYLGAGLITAALASIVLAVDNTEVIFKGLVESGVDLGLIKSALISLSLILAVLFVLVERRAKQPILPLKLFRSRNYSLIICASVLFGAAFLGTILYLTQFNQQVFGASASEAGLMLLPMIGGMMVSSITVGRLVAKYGIYKKFIMAGFMISALSILTLSILQPDSPYWHEAVIMIFAGLGLGMSMPILSLVAQNEFTSKDLGTATSSVQLFRNLGSTVGTALFAGLLTSGIIASVGDPNSNAYLQTIQRSAASSHFVQGELDADTLLRINAAKSKINAEVDKQIAHLPAPAQNNIKQQLSSQQNDFSRQIITAFSDSLHHIFIINSSLMIISLFLLSFMKEKKLRDAKH